MITLRSSDKLVSMSEVLATAKLYYGEQGAENDDLLATFLAEVFGESPEFIHGSLKFSSKTPKKSANVAYPDDWVKFVCMVSPDGTIHAIGGDRYADDPGTMLVYIGLNRIMKRYVDRRLLEMGNDLGRLIC